MTNFHSLFRRASRQATSSEITLHFDILITETHSATLSGQEMQENLDNTVLQITEDITSSMEEGDLDLPGLAAVPDSLTTSATQLECPDNTYLDLSYFTCRKYRRNSAVKRRLPNKSTPCTCSKYNAIYL